MIPPASHFLYYASSTRDGKDCSPIIGFFIDAAPSEVIVRMWDQLQERLVKVSEEETTWSLQSKPSMEIGSIYQITLQRALLNELVELIVACWECKLGWSISLNPLEERSLLHVNQGWLQTLLKQKWRKH
ncbi:hypothetical protein CMV_026278 [Castanea mollissima]|uniref:AAR2 N-terminal domain-containing protein n=1 Tax=Castanea mollissima TaxID=60419 RepID=A0A8J4QDA8_9ROSI|nr:hypothetical protein CMV_026278 [Castanea mollissima]